MRDDADKTAKHAAVPIDEPAPQTVKSDVYVDPIPSMSMPSTERSALEPTSVHRDRATLTVLTGVDAGQTFALEGQATVLGRAPTADVRFDDAGVSRQHARIWRMSDGRYFLEDLKSTNGTLVGTRRIDRTELRPSDRVQIGPHVLLRFELVDVTEEELQRRLFESSTRDALTRVYNRKYLMDRLAAECAHARRHANDLSAIMLDLDGFKAINDTYGHLTGDAVLSAVAATVGRLIRLEDVFARFGGEEFVVLARSTPHADAVRLAERIRKAVEELEIGTTHGPLKVTLSAGVASFAELAKADEAIELVGRADARLYRAKREGRNRTCHTD